MNRKDIFFKDMESCEVPFSHIEEGITNPALKKIDEIYGAADMLSIENAIKHQRNLWLLAFFGTSITFFFLIYDEAEIHWLIFACVVIIFLLFYLNKMAHKTDTHRKYVEYRVLAETLRVHYFLTIAGIKDYTSIILPWFTKKGAPWINEILLSLPQTDTTEKREILDCWIIDQKEYHKSALIKSTKNNEKNDKFTQRALIITLATYFIALFFEIYMMTNPSGEINIDIFGAVLNVFQSVGAMVGYDQVDMIRSILKIVIGSMSAFTLFVGSYYGKMSLANEIEDHRRMSMLYEKAENEVMERGETNDLIISLAHEFLIENGIWYAYQSKNMPDLTLE